MSTKNEGKPLMHLFMHIGKLLNERLRSALGERGIHFGQSRIIVALHEHGQLTQAEIGRGLHIRSASVTNMIKKLEAAALITRQQDDKDERVLLVSLTEEGTQAALFVLEVTAEVEKDIRESLGDTDIESLRQPLESVRNKLGGTDPEI